MDEYLNKQLERSRLITNFLTNTNKMGKNRLTPEIWNVRLDLLQQYWLAFQEAHLVLVGYEDTDDSEYSKGSVYEQTEWAYTEASAHARAQIVAMTPVVEVPRPAVAANEPQANPGAGYTAKHLPKIQLPTFSGSLFEWEKFKEMYTSLVYNDVQIPQITKLQYLMLSLTGDAAKRVSNTRMTGANLAGTWGTLLRRYDNHRLLFQAHVDRILALPHGKTRHPEELSRLLDTIEEARRAAEALGRPVNHWDDWYASILVSKLDKGTREVWEASRDDPAAFPTWAQLLAFMEGQIRSLESVIAKDDTRETIASSARSPKGGSRSKPGDGKSSRCHVTQAEQERASDEKGHADRPSSFKCPQCSQKHGVAFCPQFKALTVDKRAQLARQLGVCFNCLKSGHQSANCSRSKCLVCGGSHNTLLHRDTVPSRHEKSNDCGAESSGNTVSCTSVSSSAVLFATAYVYIVSPAGKKIRVRALLDSASEESYVTEHVAQILNLTRKPASLQITGLGSGVTATASHQVSIDLGSTVELGFKLTIRAYVLPRLTSLLPSSKVDRSGWDHLGGLVLADPEFGKPGRVDCLLGAEVYAAVLRPQVRIGPKRTPVGIETALGWVVLGPTDQSGTSRTVQSSSLMTVSLQDISEQMIKFWALEEVKGRAHVSPKDADCLELYETQYERSPGGRFTVPIPFSHQVPVFTGSRRRAEACLRGLESRFSRDIKLKEKYLDFMYEYEKLGHMRLANAEEEYSYYIPHHGVTKNDGSGKLRVVFNASQKSDSGKSLNDCVHAGPKLHTDLWIVLSRFRHYRVGVACDVVKMFRQILVKEEHARWQRIVWRKSPREPVRTYELLTVTYGTAYAPFAANWVMQKLAALEKNRFPHAARSLLRNTYVDDVLVGGRDSVEAKTIARELTEIFASAECQLSRWASNRPAVLPSPQSQDIIDLGSAEDASALGLIWRTQEDTLTFRIPTPVKGHANSKRQMLSDLLRLPDPLGFALPVLVRGKLLIQDLWLQGSDWDQQVDSELQQRWDNLWQDVQALATVSAPRWSGLRPETSWTLHGFADASERAFAAALYAVAVDDDGNSRSRLLIARGRVAPVKTRSLPKLELCSAHLLAQLVHHYCEQMLHAPDATYCYSDSTVTLCWLRNHPSKWVQFVANRVADIHELVPGVHWRHVRSAQNPADCATRGFTTSELRLSKLWFEGPDWLSLGETQWPSAELQCSSTTTGLRKTVVVVARKPLTGIDPFQRFSNLNRLQYAFAWIFKWRELAAQRRAGAVIARPLQITTESLRWAEVATLRLAQRSDFPTEMVAVEEGSRLPRGSPLRFHAPFVDSQGILRVGGRLQNAPMSYVEAHPAILSRHSSLALLLMRAAHLQANHGGVQLTWSYLLRSHWILRGRLLARSVVLQCVRCARFRATPFTQLMAPLPKCRVQYQRPFLHVGVDFAGPFTLKFSPGRGSKTTKGYVALFVCMGTRAIHLEVVSDLITRAFLAALTRFSARRGTCSDLYSDNGRNFVGASAELTRLFQPTSEFMKEAVCQITSQRIRWHFNTPLAPHHGGIWEAGVKSFKHHLARVVGLTTLTFEEFATLTAMFEENLNMRPLAALSSDPLDLTALTPFHLLIGTPSRSLPDPRYDPVVIERAPHTRWAMITQLRNDLWRRWSLECLGHLQRRTKWQEDQANVQPGALVLIVDQQRPPGSWPLARILETLPGTDGKVRSVRVRTATAEYLRPITKLAPLPVSDKAAAPLQPETVGGDAQYNEDKSTHSKHRELA